MSPQCETDKSGQVTSPPILPCIAQVALFPLSLAPSWFRNTSEAESASDLIHEVSEGVGGWVGLAE